MWQIWDTKKNVLDTHKTNKRMKLSHYSCHIYEINT